VIAERLTRSVNAALRVLGRSAREIFGLSYDLKIRSSMTLFNKADGGAGEKFRLAVQRLFAGQPDSRTLETRRGGISRFDFAN
jgi:uncharacterized protein (DUF1810 family)